MILQIAFSTLGGLIALAASYFRLTARSRFFVLACGLASFAIPIGAVHDAIARWFPAVPSLPMFPVPLAATAPRAATPRAFTAIDMALVAWAIVATAIIVITAIRTLMFSRRALAGVTQPSDRDRAALHRVAHGLSMQRAPRLVRSRVSGPFLIGIISPVIVMPDAELSDVEIESLLAHECAHALRRDNLLSAFEHLVAAAYWFHPLIWFMRRRLAVAREQACDEYAAQVTAPDAVASAMRALAQVSLASTSAVVSGAGGANLNERINHIMRFDSIRRAAPSHRTVIAIVLTLLTAVTAVAATATAVKDMSAVPRYLLTYSMTRGENNVQLAAKIVDTETAKVVAQPTVTFAPEQSVRTSSAAGDIAWILDVTDRNSAASAVLDVFQGGSVVQHTTYVLAETPASGPKGKYQGAPISLDLKDADLRDVLDTFAKLQKIEFIIDPDVSGKVSISASNTPWDEILDRIITGAGYHWNIEGRKLHVHK